jgi:formate--tetrahydrofolate ligase
LNAVGAMAALLKDALKPNLVQTLEGTPALIHGGPFANIAHGCNSVIATKMALKLSDYTITEAGFGADLGAQKFFDIKCRSANLKPDAVVLVATIRALKMHGGVAKENLAEENLPAIKAGFANLLRHYKNVTEVYKLPCVVAINHFPTDTQAEVEFLFNECKENGILVEHSRVWAMGGAGAISLAEKLVEICNQENNFEFSYPLNLSITEKIE